MQVRIFISKYEAASTRSRRALKFAMNMKESELDAIEKNDGTHLVCTPEQFTMFIIKRNELSGSNGIKSLYPVIIDSYVGEVNVTKRRK